MRANQGQMTAGVILVVLGVLFLTANLLEIGGWRLFWPLVLIAAGAWILVGPARSLAPGVEPRGRILGATELGREPWTLDTLDIQSGLGEVSVDLTRAHIPPGRHAVGISGWVGDVDLRLPHDLPVSVRSYVVAGKLDVLGRREAGLTKELVLVSPDYESAETRVDFDIHLLAGDITVARVE